MRARDTAKAHFDLATELEQRGTGSRLNALRAQQQLSTDEGLVETARLALYRAQEALGVLIVADGPVDAADEPAFDVPPTTAPAAAARPLWRTDLRLFAAQQQAAERVVRDSTKDWLAVRSTRSSSRRRPIRRSSSCRRTAGGCCCRPTCRSSTAASARR